MNLFPRRSYFLLAISMGPTSLYPDKPSPKNDPFFGTLKKNRNVRTIRMAVVSRRDLSYSTLSRRKPFPKKHTFGGAAATTAAEEFPVPARPHPITQGYHIPFGSSPSLRLYHVLVRMSSKSLELLVQVRPAVRISPKNTPP